jgi:ketosteroid isomerase-like protein
MKNRSDAGLVLIAVAFAAAACAKEAVPEAATTPPPPPAITREAANQALQEAVAALAAGDAAKASTGYATDGVFISARGPVEGQAAIQTFWAEALKGGAGKDLKIELTKFGTSGDLAYLVGRFTGGITASSGHVMMIMQRQADGSLKTVAQTSIPDPPKK